MSDRRCPQVVVIGSLNMDLVTRAERAPVKGETVLGQGFDMVPGGKGANQAVALAKLNAECTLIGARGDDDFGGQLVKSLDQHGVNTSKIKKVPGVTTGVATIVVAEEDNSIIVVPGANFHCTPEDIEKEEELIRQADVVLIQMEIPVETVCKGIELAAKHGTTVVLNPAPARKLPAEIYSRIDYLTPNITELAILAGEEAELQDKPEPRYEKMMRALADNGVKHVITTLGEEGAAYLAAHGEILTMPAYPVHVIDTTGAGDAFSAALAFSLGLGKPQKEAIEFASKAAALSVTRFGAQAGMPSLAEIENAF
ncbi:ribokinase [Paenibacillus senegalensis]|uniref:ribokinase n=1 Tax=Paenibacillus senegalensis TaxID=1465766 RepID=UPI000287A49E|nr:ribokinase [Paenibacillus senegalensis]